MAYVRGKETIIALTNENPIYRHKGPETVFIVLNKTNRQVFWGSGRATWKLGVASRLRADHTYFTTTHKILLCKIGDDGGISLV